MVSDRRTGEEKEKRYPPSPATLVRTCTAPICGDPSDELFDFVDARLAAYLREPDRSAADLYRDFVDAVGSYRSPRLAGTSDGRFLEHFESIRDEATADALSQARPDDWLDVLRVKNVGPDTYYDLFRGTLLRYIKADGVCLPLFCGPWGPLDDVYLRIDGPAGTDYVIARTGAGYTLDTSELYVMPVEGRYQITLCTPMPEFVQPGTVYQEADLQVTAFASQLDVLPISLLLRVDLPVNRLRVRVPHWCTKVSVHSQLGSYRIGFGIQRNKRGQVCGPNMCRRFAFTDQKELEGTVLRGASVDFGDAMFVGLEPARYKVIGYNEQGWMASTVRDLDMNASTDCQVWLRHRADLSRLDGPLPPRAFLEGDIVRQSQRDTSDCGPFSLAHAASYWEPGEYGPTKKNGKWFAENLGDWQPGTLQSTLASSAASLGFCGEHFIIDFGEGEIGPTIQEEMQAINNLKAWIVAGVPVIVAIDEHMEESLFAPGAEHYKVLVGYDDGKELRYKTADGRTEINLGALYFINSGAFGKGERHNRPEEAADLPPYMRETFADYREAPIGNDVDSYLVFTNKWRIGGLAPFTDNFWFFPVYPA